jgi:hypothetical protein
LGFSTGAEAEVARYHVDGRELNLLIADFPTPQTAQKKLNELQQDYHVNAADADRGGPPVFGKRSITLLAIVFGARTQAEADKLLDQVQSGAEVTWNFSVQRAANHYDDCRSDHRHRNNLLLRADIGHRLWRIPACGEAILAG